MFCKKCGTELVLKPNGIDGMVPFCTNCTEFQFELYSIAVSMIIYSKDLQKILLTIQPNKKKYIFVAGYVNKGENLEDAVRREIQEEIHVEVENIRFNTSKFYEATQTLMVNFICNAKTDDFELTEEVVNAQWVSIEEAINLMNHETLAYFFLNQHITSKKLEDKVK